MVPVRDRILVVESDTLVADLIGRQALQAVGYQVFVAGDATAAIAKALQWSPDLIITNTNLPGLSGKDLMVALSSQGVTTPLILVAPKNQETDIIQTFRLGAADFLLLPVREAEVISAVERVLKQVHERRERDRLAQQLQQTNQELQQRVRELTTIFAVGKAVTSITDMNLLMEKVLEGATRVTQADIGWFLMRDDMKKPFTLVAGHHLPTSLGVAPGQVWDDGISSLVAMSGEALAIHGEPLKRFKIYSLGQSALIAPIKVQKNVIGLLVMMRRQAAAFSPSEQHLLDALADYASISLVNAHLFRAADERSRALQNVAESAQLGERINNDILRTVKKEVGGAVEIAAGSLSRLGKDPTARWRPDQRQQLSAIQDALEELEKLSGSITPLPLSKITRESPRAQLNEQVAQARERCKPFAQAGNLTIQFEPSSEVLWVAIEPVLVAQILDGLLSNAVKFSPAGAKIVVQTGKQSDGQVVLTVRNSGAELPAKGSTQIFDESFISTGKPALRPGGLGIRLSLIKDILARHGGKIQAENQTGKFVQIQAMLPPARG
jgi:K+-sensing histidine kinase KdpD